MRKPQSTKKKLILPTSLAFVFLVAAMIAAAFSLFSTSVTSSTNEQTLAASEQVLTNYESYFDSVITVSNNVLGTYSNASETSLAQDMGSYFDTLETFKAEIWTCRFLRCQMPTIFRATRSPRPRSPSVVAKAGIPPPR
jgi:flagellar basal body-associated protein FliL